MNKSEIDLTLRLRVSADLCGDGDLPDTSVLAELQRLAADEIERLRSIVNTPAAEREHYTMAIQGGDLWAREIAERKSVTDRFGALDARLAELESRVRLHGHRIDAAREAMRECAANDRLHNSVRFLADTLAINLGSNPAPAPETPR